MKKDKWDALVKGLKDRGYVMVEGIMYPPNAPEAINAMVRDKVRKRSKVLRTGWTDDTRNIRNKEKYNDPFIQLIKLELSLDVWAEFYFSTDRLYRFDYAIPDIMVAVECNGGVWARGNSGHSSGKGILRDYDKSNLAQSLGWTLINVTPDQIMTSYTVNLIHDLKKRI